MIFLYSSRAEVINHWMGAFSDIKMAICENEEELYSRIDTLQEEMVLLLEHRQYHEIKAFLSLFQTTYPHIKIMLFSNKPSYEEGYELLPFGIKAYANTYMAHIHLKDALNTVLLGNIWLYPEFIQMMIQSFSKPHPSLHVNDILSTYHLTEREIQIALLLKKGLSNKEIAERTGISERTVKAHLSAVFEKTGIKDRLALALAL
ncbi:response regulator transcription factor [Sulfuricurvum sp.]|uniref:response regulator transcription factor n=1 Tax=Sulfuricurvum sp. TaxID=2025608 RepID=UPI00261FDACE|nr:response regulator transcription factor [Sulfuricurvum sp.]MDD2267826.1 response regulator transcription factor [Sulfuricurvum sp.]MDD2784370.1 response regulator transcription factor [Sulfuricurvum sp.]